MLLLLYIALIKSIPKFTYILADQNSKSECRKMKEDINDYFSDGIYTRFPKKQAEEISKAYQGFLCTNSDYDIDDALEQVSSKTELLVIYAYDVEDELDFNDLKTKMVVHISGIDEDFHNFKISEKSKQIISQISNMAKNMFAISYDVNSHSKNVQLSQELSKNIKRNSGISSNKAIEIDGEMKKKVSFLAVFEQYKLIFDSDLDCENVYLYDCRLRNDDSIKIKSQILLVDQSTYSSLYSLQQSGKIKVSVNQFGLIMEKKQTIRLIFSSEDASFEYSDLLFPPEDKQYDPAILNPVPRSWFQTITVLSSSTQYSLYLNRYFNPKTDTLPGINISINDPETEPMSFLAKESVDIRTDSWNDGAWDQFAVKPSISVDCDGNKYSVNAPNGIQVKQTDHNQANNNNDKNKKKLIIIIVSVCAAVIVVVIIIVVVVVKCRNKYDHKVVYINDDENHQNANQLSSQISNGGFTDNMDDKKDEKELSDPELEKKDEDTLSQSNNSNNQSHESIATSQPTIQYPQSGDSHPGYPQPATPTGSASNLPTDQPNSAYTVPF